MAQKFSKTSFMMGIKGLKAFERDYPQATCLLFYGGEKKQKEGNISLVPIKDAFAQIPQLIT